jgi:HEAT repeat protein
VLQRVPDMPAPVRERLSRLPDRLSEPDALSQLLQAMDEAETLPPQEELADLFAELRPTALGTVFARLGQSQNAKLRPLLELAAERLAQSNTAELVRLIGSDDPVVAVEAAKRCGGLRSAAAVPALAKALDGATESLRLAAVTALGEIGTPGAMQALQKALGDTDRDVRVTAVRALAQRAYKPALTQVTELIRSREIRSADRTERLAIFELYGALCGDAGVSYLDELLNGKSGLFARKEDPDIRACAAIALGKVGSTGAQNALQRAMGEKDVIVRSAVTRALKGGAA